MGTNSLSREEAVGVVEEILRYLAALKRGLSEDYQIAMRDDGVSLGDVEALAEDILDSWHRQQPLTEVPKNAREACDEIQEIVIRHLAFGITVIGKSRVNCALPKHDHFPHEHGLSPLHRSCSKYPREHKFCRSHKLSVCVVCGGRFQ